MLQVITGMYFGDVALNETEHRRTIYTNVDFSEVGPVDMPVSYECDRDLLVRSHSRRTDTDVAKYRRVKSAASSDGWRSSRRPTDLDQHL
ncbi:hypothetical protein [Micromonospora sp. NBC_01638]|uniref:hypothetical protein n=1 Tax=Micromonospora sp. NBC_01638 TaxID=2975982 RepID=UPI00386E5FBF|nr:hypothetical protein OG811_00445 [Micromonospora sp. NBC_01638]